MNQQALEGATGAATVVGLASLFLPSLETAWDARPDDVATRRLRTGEYVYLGVVATIATLYSLRARSVAPLLVAAALAGTVIVTYERALRDTA